MKRELEVVLCQLNSREAQMGFWPLRHFFWWDFPVAPPFTPIFFGLWDCPLQTNLRSDFPFLGHLELCRINQEISYIGIHKDQRKGSKNSLWFTRSQWFFFFPHHNLLLLRVRHSRQNPVFLLMRLGQNSAGKNAAIYPLRKQLLQTFLKEFS